MERRSEGMLNGEEVGREEEKERKREGMLNGKKE